MKFFDGSFSQFLKFIVLSIGLSLFFIQMAEASTLPLPAVGNYGGMVQDPGTISSVEGGVAQLIVGAVLNLRYLLTAISIGFIIFAGFRMVTAQGNEEAWKNAKVTMTWSIIGLAMVGLSGEFVRIFAVGKCAELGLLPGSSGISCQEGGFLKNPAAIIQRTTLFNQAIGYIITFIKYLIGSLAVVMLLRNAIRMSVNQAGDELAKDKKNLTATIIGLILIIVADPIINNVLFKIDTSRYPSTGGAQAGIDYAQGVKEIIGFTNVLVSVLTPLAILFIVIGGFQYITSRGDAGVQEKAKRMITLSLIGLVIIYGAFAIVSTFISGQFNGNAAVNPAEINSNTPTTPATT